MSFKVGDRVVATQNVIDFYSTTGISGTVIDVTPIGENDPIPYLVEFDSGVGGHNGGINGAYGKDGHCLYCGKDDLKLEETQC